MESSPLPTWLKTSRQHLNIENELALIKLVLTTSFNKIYIRYTDVIF